MKKLRQNIVADESSMLWPFAILLQPISQAQMCQYIYCKKKKKIKLCKNELKAPAQR